MKILVVDDDDTLSSMIARVIRKIGCEVKTCANGQDALDLLCSSKFSLLFLDLIMPGMGGVQVLKELQHRGIEVATVVMSGNLSHSLKSQCIKYGAKRFVQKPIEISDIESIIMGERFRDVKVDKLEDTF